MKKLGHIKFGLFLLMFIPFFSSIVDARQNDAKLGKSLEILLRNEREATLNISVKILER